MSFSESHGASNVCVRILYCDWDENWPASWTCTNSAGPAELSDRSWVSWIWLKMYVSSLDVCGPTRYGISPRSGRSPMTIAGVGDVDDTMTMSTLITSLADPADVCTRT